MYVVIYLLHSHIEKIAYTYSDLKPDTTNVQNTVQPQI